MSVPARQVTCVTARCSRCGSQACNDDEGYTPHFDSIDAARNELTADYGWQITIGGDGSERWLCRDCAQKTACEQHGHDPEISPQAVLEDGSTIGQSVWCARCGHPLSTTPRIAPPDGYPAPQHATAQLHWDAAALPHGQAITAAARTLLDTLNAAAVTARWDAWPGDQTRRPPLRPPAPAEQATAAAVLTAAVQALRPAAATAELAREGGPSDG